MCRALLNLLTALVLTSALGTTLVACEHDDGPLEEAGEAIDEAAEDTKDAVEDAVD